MPRFPQLRADYDALVRASNTAIEQLYEAIEGARLVKVSTAAYFKGGIETEEELDAALDGLQRRVAHIWRRARRYWCSRRGIVGQDVLHQQRVPLSVQVACTSHQIRTRSRAARVGVVQQSLTLVALKEWLGVARPRRA